jgi:hypothetical protein
MSCSDPWGNLIEEQGVPTPGKIYAVHKDTTSMLHDAVNNPNHYNHKGIECIAAIEASMEPQQFQGYLKGNVLKYLWRYEYKNGLEDLKKAQWYLNKLVDKLDV